MSRIHGVSSTYTILYQFVKLYVQGNQMVQPSMLCCLQNCGYFTNTTSDDIHSGGRAP